MRNSIKSIKILSALLLFFTPSAFGQSQTKKYIRKNRNPVVISCGDRTIYARGIHTENHRIFTGNSNGALYYFNTHDNTSQLLFKLNDFTEMRDIERSGEYLIGIQSDNGGKMVRISNSGALKVITHKDWDSVFIDAIDFMGDRGFMLGDPTEGNFTLYHTNDGGAFWTACDGKVPARKGEAGFASSGTNVQVLNDSTYVFVSGGSASRFFKSTDNGQTWKDVTIPFYPGESSGAFSVCFANDSVGVITGGDYINYELSNNTAYYTLDGGASWFNSENMPKGYRACVFYKNGVFYSAGRNGIDFSTDNGKNWTPFSKGTYFSLSATEDKLVATCKNGEIKLFDLVSN